jgi:hypothetical protein
MAENPLDIQGEGKLYEELRRLWMPVAYSEALTPQDLLLGEVAHQCEDDVAPT